MASMQQQPSQRRPSLIATPSQESTATSPAIEAQATEEQQEAIPSDDTPAEATMQDEEISDSEQAQQGADQTIPPPLLSADDDPSVKKCWICFSDSTEDTPETSPWRNPCPCALVAHEECLLDWIADMEAPKNTVRGDILKPKIQCPQCKGEIKLARPRSYVVDLVRILDRSKVRYAMPVSTILLSFDMLYKLTFTHGVHTIFRVFGEQDAQRILQPVLQGAALNPEMTYREVTLAQIAHHTQHMRLYIGLPLIAPMLLLSRARWHLSEAVLTVLPTLLFVLQPPAPGEKFTFSPWPPSASMAFAVLPYVRQAYNYYYERVWGERIHGWKKELLPVTTQAQADAQPAHDPVQAIEDAADGDGNVFEIRVDGGIWEEWEEPAPGQEGAAPAPNIPDNRRQQANPPPPAQANAPPPAAQRQQIAERRLSFSPLALAENVFGALVFPSIAELSGELLKLVLPKTWTTLPTSAGSRAVATGLLQQKWARTLLGGCLFVVSKDALMLYVRWKMVQMHRNRRVLDYDRSKAKA